MAFVIPSADRISLSGESTASSPSKTANSQDCSVSGIKTSEILLRIRKGMGSERIEVLERLLQKTDRSRTGSVKTEEFKSALNASGLNLRSEEVVRLCQSYGLDGLVQWPEFMNDVCNIDDFMLEEGDKSDPLRKSPRSDANIEVEELLNQLSIFFNERRVLVSDSFSDFERPGKFCKRVQRVTANQFKEAVFFLTKGMNNFSDVDMNMILSHYQDFDGLVRYREFIRDVEPKMDVSSGFLVPFHFNTDRSVSPSKSNSSLGANSNAPSRSSAMMSRSPSLTSSPALLGVQPMGPADCQNPCRLDFNPIAGCRVSPTPMERVSVDDVMARIRHFCATFNIIMVDHMRVGDKLREGSMTKGQFRRTMDVLRVFKLSGPELDALEAHYMIEVSNFGNPDIRFHYRRFCEDLQPTGHDWAVKNASLRHDDSSISPLAINQISESEMSNLSFVMERIGTSILKRRLCFRQYFEDFDRTTKTRTGSTRHNYTLNAGCISRSQLLQALKSMGLSQLLGDEDFSILFKRYERNGEFNYLVFLRDLDQVEKRLLAAVMSPHV